jgi:radical SAM protein with 4Fe4S-binding SPASM domain
MKELNQRELFIILEQYIDLIKTWEMDKNKRVRKLSLSGGEPLLRKDFFKLLEEIYKNRNMFTSVIVMSNGSTINDKVAKKMKALGVSGVQISLDGLEKNNDHIRGEGSFRKTMNGIDKLIKNEMTVGISMTVYKGNFDDVEGLIGLCKEMGIGSISLSRLVPMGRAKELKILEPLETKKFYEKIMELKREWKGRGVNVGTHCSDSLWFIEDSNHETHGCSAGYDSFSVLPNGDVVPCRRFPLKVGNVLEKSLIDIWYTSDFLWKLRNKGNISSCRNCELFAKCLGGARCVSYGYSKDIFASDPQCWKLFKTLPKKTKSSEASKDLILNENYIESFDPKTYFDRISKV